MHAEFVFDSVPFPACHAATIVGTRHGLIAAWFAGEDEGSPDVGIWMSHHDGTGWSQMTEVATGLQENGRRYACWNPVLFATANETLMLFYKVGKSPRSWWGMLMTSSDGGVTWSQPQRLPDDILGPVKNKPVQLGDGTLLCGSSSEQKGWTRTDCLNDGRNLAAIQPTIFNHPSGELQILCRTRQEILLNLGRGTKVEVGARWD
jgi:predicted neuraminidase